MTSDYFDSIFMFQLFHGQFVTRNCRINEGSMNLMFTLGGLFCISVSYINSRFISLSLPSLYFYLSLLALNFYLCLSSPLISTSVSPFPLFLSSSPFSSIGSGGIAGSPESRILLRGRNRQFCRIYHAQASHQHYSQGKLPRYDSA